MTIAPTFREAVGGSPPWDLRAEPAVHQQLLHESKYGEVAARLRMIGNLVVPHQGLQALAVLLNGQA